MCIIPDPDAAPPKPKKVLSSEQRVLCTGLALGMCLIPIRAATIGFDWWSLRRPFEEVPKIVIGACYDLMFVAAMTGAVLIAMRLFSRSLWMQRLLLAGYGLSAIGLLLVGLANIEIVRMLGRPFNYQWLYYSGFLVSEDAKASIAASMDWRLATIATWLCLGLIIGARLAQAALGALYRRGVSGGAVLAAVLPLVGSYFFFAHWFLVTQHWPAGKLVNPITSFAASTLRTLRAPALFTMSTSVGPEEFTGLPAAELSSSAPRDAQVRNVVFFVLESVPAEFVEAYGGPYPVTPNLQRFVDRAVVFDNIYAHAPATNKSLVSILCSAYPWVSYKTLTQERPDAPLDSLSSVFAGRGARTGFFASGDLLFQGAGKFLAHRDFQIIQDYRQRPKSNAQFESKDYPYLNGTDDRATVGSLLEWIDADDREAFCSVLWTNTTHHPYFVTGEVVDYGVSDASLNRYLNALKHVDESLGELLDGLEKRGLLDSTLVVVVADHGEAFGRHGQRGHGTHIYEENLRVPLILINARLFAGGRFEQIGGLVDVAPTVADVLGIEPLPGWQGRSLFSSNRTGRTYFFAPWSDYLFGFREGNLKLIYNASNNSYEVYDLRTDPLETTNLADGYPEFIARAQQHLAGWVQHQARMYAW